MKEIFINKARAVAVTGHRTLYPDYDYNVLKNTLKRLVLDGYNTFLVGMALGFDTECFKALEEIRKEEKIYIIACVPCLSQADRFSQKQKIEYKRMLSCADETVILSEKYTPNCMQKRNEYMVDNASVLVSYLRRDYGGTKNTVNYAKKTNCNIIEM